MATELVFHHDAKAHTLSTKIISITPYQSLAAENQALFKIAEDVQKHHYAIATEATVFHPQGGGQPSDVGKKTNANGVVFEVISARMNAQNPDEVLHCGRYVDANSSFQLDETITQEIDTEKRLLYSRYHTAGHVLGSAVRTLLEKSVPDFDELKASHVPGAAACEFQGSIDGKHKDSIQAEVDRLVAASLPVEIEWWTAEDFKAHDMERLIPEGPVPRCGKWRVVNIVGAEVYPCGGTHVTDTKECGKTTVTKIKRTKGTSRVSYSL